MLINTGFNSESHRNAKNINLYNKHTNNTTLYFQKYIFQQSVFCTNQTFRKLVSLCLLYGTVNILYNLTIFIVWGLSPVSLVCIEYLDLYFHGFVFVMHSNKTFTPYCNPSLGCVKQFTSLPSAFSLPPQKCQKNILASLGLSGRLQKSRMIFLA